MAIHFRYNRSYNYENIDARQQPDTRVNVWGWCDSRGT